MISGNALCNFRIKCLAHKTLSSLIHTNVMIISYFVLMCDVIPRDRKCSVICEVRETPRFGEERHWGIVGNSVMSCGIYRWLWLLDSFQLSVNCYPSVITVTFLRNVTRPCTRTVPSNCTDLSCSSHSISWVYVKLC